MQFDQLPTFRALFTAIYIENPKLAPVEKLFHLNKKTSGEAHDIVAQAPLTNEGFASAWNALRERFQNKRLILKAQLKILFSLPQIRTESAAALKELHRAVHKCLTTLTHSEVSTDSVFADGVLVYLISAKLPKTTLELWEQSVTHKSEIPNWHAMDKFLAERYLSLEMTEDDHPGMETQAHSRASIRSSDNSRSNPFRSQGSPYPRSAHSFETTVNQTRSTWEYNGGCRIGGNRDCGSAPNAAARLQEQEPEHRQAQSYSQPPAAQPPGHEAQPEADHRLPDAIAKSRPTGLETIFELPVAEDDGPTSSHGVAFGECQRRVLALGTGEKKEPCRRSAA
ncbi:GL11983 [Drosophila persimilis]|uniref:GL11983 n=1 Tax=Drosophila persimilis TaxID=7234 RepID=B4GLR4_DROPE|nr:GL11983 [Drosophila persimilis]